MGRRRPQPGSEPACPRAGHDYGAALGHFADRPHREGHTSADLGVNPSNDGKIIRIPIPPLNEERRKDLAKRLHVIAEDHRVAIRNIRRDANEQIKKSPKRKRLPKMKIAAATKRRRR